MDVIFQPASGAPWDTSSICFGNGRKVAERSRIGREFVPGLAKKDTLPRGSSFHKEILKSNG